MKRILLFLALISLVSNAACGKEETTKVYSTPEGKVEITQKEEGKVQEMQVTTKEGTATMKVCSSAVPEDLGVPIYPGVKKQEGGTWSMSEAGQEGEQGFSATILFSEDPLDKVSAFYKEKLQGSEPQIFEMDMPQGKMVNITVDKEEAATTIVLTENKDKQGTNIQITKADK